MVRRSVPGSRRSQQTVGLAATELPWSSPFAGSEVAKCMYQSMVSRTAQDLDAFGCCSNTMDLDDHRLHIILWRAFVKLFVRIVLRNCGMIRPGSVRLHSRSQTHRDPCREASRGLVRGDFEQNLYRFSKRLIDFCTFAFSERSDLVSTTARGLCSGPRSEDYVNES